MKNIILLFSLMITNHFLVACASSEKNNHGLVLISEAEYEKLTQSYTDKVQIYSGLYNIMDISGTVVNSSVARAQLDQSARLYEWDAAKMTTEKVKSDEDLNKETEVFISFYTPERKHDDLQKNKTLWKIFLDANGKRYEGKAKKIKLLTQEIRGLYPYHTQFATPYLITFPVSTKSVEGTPLKLTITGSVGSASLNFKPTGAN